MQLAVRSYLMAGVAVAGVSAMALNPVTPAMPGATTPSVSSAAVELSALANPVEQFAAAFEQAFANAEALGQVVAANPAPILTAILNNQVSSVEVLAEVARVVGEGLSAEFTTTVPEQLQAAFDDIAAGQVTEGLSTAYQAVLGAVVSAALPLLFGPLGEQFPGIIQNPFENLSNVVNTVTNPGNILGVALAPLGLVQGTIDVVGPTAEAFLGAAEDPEAFANAVLSFAPALTNAILNGDIASPGLLAPFTGLANNLLTLRQTVANAIEPLVPETTLRTALPAANETAMDGANTVQVNITETTSPSGSATKTALQNDSLTVGSNKLSGDNETNSTAKAKPVNDVRNGIASAAKNVRNGLRSAAESLGVAGGNAAKAATTSTSDGNGSSSTSDNGATSSTE